MIRRAAPALALLSIVLTGSVCAQPASGSIAHWTAENQRAIARVRPFKARRVQERLFEETQREIVRMRDDRASIDAPNARATALKILSNHRVFVFGGVEKPPPKSWWDRFTQWIGERWKAAFKALFGRMNLSGTAGVAIGDVLLVLSVVLFLGLLGRVVWMYGRRASGPRTSVHPLDGAQDPGLLSARAAAAAERGDYASAVGLLFAAAVVVLNSCGAFAGAPGETIGEMRRSVRSTHRQYAQDFDELASALTLSVYADARIDAERYARSRASYEAVLRASEVSRAA